MSIRAALLVAMAVLAFARDPGALAAAADGAVRSQAEPEPRLGRNGGLAFAAGAFTGELIVWETEIVVFAYDKAGDALAAHRLGGTVRVLPTDPRGRAFDLQLGRREERLAADANIRDARTLQLVVTLKVDGKPLPPATLRWRRDDDRARLNDRRTRPARPAALPGGADPMQGLKR